MYDDDGYTYRGNRSAAIKGVFKLRRMKSSAKLQSFCPKQDTQIQKCSVCHKPGHNRRSTACPGPDQPAVEDNIDENISDNPVEVGELGIETGDADIGELEDLPDTSLNYFIFHFVDETVIDDE